jgi:hypothetical protein
MANAHNLDDRPRLAERFLAFQEERDNIHRRMESYALDYRLQGPSATQRYEALPADVQLLAVAIKARR